MYHFFSHLANEVEFDKRKTTTITTTKSILASGQQIIIILMKSISHINNEREGGKGRQTFAAYGKRQKIRTLDAVE